MASSTSTSPVPANTSSNTEVDPAQRRMFQFTDLKSNHNKFYLVEVWPAQGDTVRFRCYWGRVGAKPQVYEKIVPRRSLDRQISGKYRKGYRELDMDRS